LLVIKFQKLLLCFHVKVSNQLDQDKKRDRGVRTLKGEATHPSSSKGGKSYYNLIVNQQ
jgi:hypothetical protein